MDYKIIFDRYVDGKLISSDIVVYHYNLQTLIELICKWNNNYRGWVYCITNVRKCKKPPLCEYGFTYANDSVS